MTDPGPLMDAIEADPADDAAWLVLADWLEERGEPLADRVRDSIGRRSWDSGWEALFRGLDPSRRRWVDCDCAERVLPLFERAHPRDRGPRQYLEELRRRHHGLGDADRTGSPFFRSCDAAFRTRSPFFKSCDAAFRSARRYPRRYMAAWASVLPLQYLIAGPRIARLLAANAAVVGVFGPEAHQPSFEGLPPDWRFGLGHGRGDPRRRPTVVEPRPEWLALRDAEIRWQIARMLRYRIGGLAVT